MKAVQVEHFCCIYAAVSAKHPELIHTACCVYFSADLFQETSVLVLKIVLHLFPFQSLRRSALHHSQGAPKGVSNSCIWVWCNKRGFKQLSKEEWESLSPLKQSLDAYCWTMKSLHIYCSNNSHASQPTEGWELNWISELMSGMLCHSGFTIQCQNGIIFACQLDRSLHGRSGFFQPCNACVEAGYLKHTENWVQLFTY